MGLLHVGPLTGLQSAPVSSTNAVRSLSAAFLRPMVLYEYPRRKCGEALRSPISNLRPRVFSMCCLTCVQSSSLRDALSAVC